jgi:hypothetical protein
MTNPLYTLREVEHQWHDADVEIAITTDFIWEAIEAELATFEKG